MIGSQVGPFTIVEEIGQGGMGTVYRAVDRRSQQPVAVKVLKPELVANTPDLLERFAREGEALRALNHPSIVKVLDTLENDGRHFLVMEFVPGGSLADLLAHYPQLPIQQVMEIALD